MTDPLVRPIFVVGPPGSGQVALRESLLRAPGTWPASHAELTGGTRATLAATYDAEHAATTPADATPRLVSADPLVTAAIGEVAALFPDAVFLYVHRDPAHAVPDAEVGAEEWLASAAAVLDDLEALGPDRWQVVDTAVLVAAPEDAVQRLFAGLDLGWHSAGSAPWRVLAQLGVPAPPPPGPPDLDALRARVRRHAADDPGIVGPGDVAATDDGLSEVLRRAKVSLLVSTYQSNRLMVLRHDRGSLGVHLREYDRPMGIAVNDGGFALGGRSEIWDYRDLPAAAPAVEPRGRHDACYLPRNSHVTGDIAVHELEFGLDGLWLVATRFSCLATLDSHHSFVPRWTPPFITALAPEDRCHLNGMALVDGVPRYVTALGTTDTPGGWRRDKVAGGVVIDVATDQVVAGGLSMPHSPRWHDGRLWVLESGRGRLSVVDPAGGTTRPVVELPGFTRGLRFAGTTAYVGTSQIRETATFGGLPIAALPKRECAVWAVDTTTGNVLGVVRFESRVQEIFDVAVVAKRFPEVVEPGGELARESWSVPPLPPR